MPSPSSHPSLPRVRDRSPRRSWPEDGGVKVEISRPGTALGCLAIVRPTPKTSRERAPIWIMCLPMTSQEDKIHQHQCFPFIPALSVIFALDFWRVRNFCQILIIFSYCFFQPLSLIPKTAEETCTFSLFFEGRSPPTPRGFPRDCKLPEICRGMCLCHGIFLPPSSPCEYQHGNFKRDFLNRSSGMT